MTRSEKSLEGLVWNKIHKREVIEDIKFRTDVAIVDDAVWSWTMFKNVRTACFCDLPMYHYLIIPTSITRNSSMDKYMKALYGYEIMLEDAEKISQNCVADLAEQYLRWNITAFSRLIYQDNPDIEIYKKIKNNCKRYKKYQEKLPKKTRIKLKIILSNFHLAKLCMKLFYALSSKDKCV